MSQDAPQPLTEKREALEEVFYREGSAEHRAALAREEEAALAALSEATGIDDEALLRRLASLGIRTETLAALTLIPLIEVAYADGVMEEKEKEAILVGAVQSGIRVTSPSYGLLKLWIADPPPPDLVSLWRDFIVALCRELDADEREHLRERVVGRARDVADAAGGFLGIGARSAVERSTIDDLSRAFDA